MESWETPHCEIVGFLDVDNESFALFRVKFSAKLPEEQFAFICDSLKSVGGTYWHQARVWIVESKALEGATEEIADFFASK